MSGDICGVVKEVLTSIQFNLDLQECVTQLQEWPYCGFYLWPLLSVVVVTICCCRYYLLLSLLSVVVVTICCCRYYLLLSLLSVVVVTICCCRYYLLLSLLSVVITICCDLSPSLSVIVADCYCNIVPRM